MVLVTLLLCVLVLHLNGSEGSRSSREKICRSDGDIRCIWLEHHLHRAHGFPIQHRVLKGSRQVLYCYEGEFWSIPPNPLVRLWDHLHVTIDTPHPDSLVITTGNDSITAQTSTRHRGVLFGLSPYESSCIAIKPAQGWSAREYKISATFHLILLYPILFIVGNSLLFLSPKYSRNAVSVYTAGVLVGVLGSVLVLLYFISRLIPGRNFLGLGILAGGTTVYGTLLYWSRELLVQYWFPVLVYVLVSGLISFAVLYIKGVSNPRTMDVLCWTLQLLGVGLIYLSSSSQLTSVILVAVSVLIYATPLKASHYGRGVAEWANAISTTAVHNITYVFRPGKMMRNVWSGLWYVWYWIFPPKLPPWEYITVEQYEEQGRVETRKALNKLRRDYISGKLNTSCLSNCARFDRFGRGEDHVTGDEQASHYWEFTEEFDEEEDDMYIGEESPESQSSSTTQIIHRHRNTSSFSSSSS